MQIVKLLGPRILIRPIMERSVSAGGIIIPEALLERTQEADVVAIGRGHMLKDGKVIPVCVKVGDRILYGKKAGVEVEYDGERMFIINDVDVVAILKEPKEG